MTVFDYDPDIGFPLVPDEQFALSLAVLKLLSVFFGIPILAVTSHLGMSFLFEPFNCRL